MPTAGPVTAQARDAEAVVVVRPEPVGAARRLPDTRGSGAGEMPPLSIDGLVEAGVRPRADFSTVRIDTSRLLTTTTTSGTTAEKQSSLPVINTSAEELRRIDIGTLPLEPVTTRVRFLSNLTPGGMSMGSGDWAMPTLGGVRLAWCSRPSAGCGKPAADQYCKRQRYDEAASFSSASGKTPGILPTVHIDNGQICDDPTCDGFARIRCTRATGSSSSPSAPAPSDPEDVAPAPASPPGDSTAAYASLLETRLQELARLRQERLAREKAEREKPRDARGFTTIGAINLLEGLHVDPEVQLLQTDVLQIDHQVYGDANPDSGLFYYVPKRFDLLWSPEAQYALTVIYGMAGPGEDEGEVLMAARLSAGVDTAELGVANELLRAYVHRHAEEGVIPLRALRPVPLEAASDIKLFGGATNEFSVAPDAIDVKGFSGLLNVLDVSWTTDVRRLLNIESLLRTKAGIRGSLTLHPAGEQDVALTVPLALDVASPQTFGRIAFAREQGFRNETWYPLRLHYLHALLLSPESRGRVREHDPIVYSWRLGDTAVPPGAGVRWQADAVPGWLDAHAVLMWVDYSVEGRCDACDEKVFSAKFIPPRPATRALTFTTGDAFESTGAYRIVVHVRSPFLEPARNRIVQQPAVILEEDGVEYPIARLFLTDREMTGDGADEPLYEYALEVTMRDGRTFSSQDWQPSRSLDFLLGSVAIERALGAALPGAAGASASP